MNISLVSYISTLDSQTLAIIFQFICIILREDAGENVISKHFQEALLNTESQPRALQNYLEEEDDQDQEDEEEEDYAEEEDQDQEDDDQDDDDEDQDDEDQEDVEDENDNLDRCPKSR